MNEARVHPSLRGKSAGGVDMVSLHAEQTIGAISFSAQTLYDRIAITNFYKTALISCLALTVSKLGFPFFDRPAFTLVLCPLSLVLL